MLILEAMLLLGVASITTSLGVSSLPSSESVYSTSRIKRDFTTPSTSVNWSTERNSYQANNFNPPYTSTSISHEISQPGTTTKISKPASQSVTPRKNNQSNGQQSLATYSAQSTIAPPYLQGGFQASQDPRYQGSSQELRQPLKPWISQTKPRVQSKVGPTLSYNSQYYSNPFKAHPESAGKSQQINVNPYPGSPLNYRNSLTATRTNRQSPTDLLFDNSPKFRFNSSPGFNIQSSPFINSPQRYNNPYQSNTFLGTKNFETTPSSGSSEFSGISNFSPFNKFGEIHQYGGPSNVGYSTKESLIPNSLQFTKNLQSSGFSQEFQPKPVHQQTGFEFHAQPSSGSSFGFPTSVPPSVTPASFSLTNGHYQSPILPIHTFNNTPQLSRYKDTSVNKYSNNEQSKKDGYQLLANQPQLHFTKSSPLQSVGGYKPVVYHSNRPFEQIRGDVEVIDKKRLLPSNPDDSYDPESDEGFKTERKPGRFKPNDDDDDDISALIKNPIRDVSFEVPNSNLFNSYDEAFGKYSKLASLERDAVRVTSKPEYLSDEDHKDKEDKSEEYGSRYSGPSEGREPTSSSFEDDDEEESRRSERHKARDEREHRNNRDDDESDSYKNFGADYEKEFDESYRRAPHKTESVHVKEVQEIDEPATEPKKRSSPNRSGTKASRNADVKQNIRQIDGEYPELKGYESYTSHGYKKPKTTYKDNEGHDSRNSYRKDPDSSSDFYIHKVPRDRGSRRYVKSDDSQVRTSDEEHQHSYLGKSTNNRDDTSNRLYNDSRQSLKFTSPDNTKTSTQRSAKHISKTIDTYESSNPRSFANTDDRGYRSPYSHREEREYFANRQAGRDLTGI